MGKTWDSGLNSTAFVLERPGQVSIQQFDVAAVEPDWVLMAVEMCGICAGGDGGPYRGAHPHARYPLILGHEMVGKVAAIGERAQAQRGLEVGDRFLPEVLIPCGHCRMCYQGVYNLCENEKQYGVSFSCAAPPHLWGAYSQYLWIHPRSITHRISREVPVERAVLVAVLANSVRWVQQRGQVQPGETVAIFGPGVQGIGSTIVAKEAGAEGILIGTGEDKQRLEMGRAMGADHLIDGSETDPLEQVRQITAGAGVDLAIEVSGAAAAVEMGLKMLRRRGRFVLAGYSADQQVSITKDEIPKKELTLIGGWGQAHGFALAIRLVESNRYPLEKLVTDRYPLTEAEQGIQDVLERRAGIKAVIVPPPTENIL